MEFLDALPDRPRLVDLGAGRGANARYLDSLGDAEIAWRLVDRDASLLNGIQGVRGETACVDFAASPELLDLSHIDGITASALFDLVSEDWFARFVAHADGLPLLFALTIDGRFEWRPNDAADRLVMDRFAADMSRDKGFGPAMGGTAPRRMFACLQEAGYRVSSAPASWRLGPDDAALLRAMAGLVGELAGDGLAAETWRQRRRLALAKGALSLTLGHVDILALS
jgi:hypothetical protein